MKQVVADGADLDLDVMVRPLRIEFPGALYHITSRGNAKQAIFLDDEDKSLFLRVLARTIRECEWRCYSYCLMDNHYHLLFETPKANLSRGMHLLNAIYAQKHNERHGRRGHLFQDRYHAAIVNREEYLLEACRYVVLNPVRAGMVEDPEHYPWSSYPDIVGRRKAPDFLDVPYVLALFSQPGRSGKDEYRSFVLAGLGVDLWSNLRGNLILGSEEFALQVQERIGRSGSMRGTRKKERFAGRPGLPAIFGSSELRKDDRNRKIVEANTEHGYSLREIAKYLDMSPSAICRIVKSWKRKNSTFET